MSRRDTIIIAVLMNTGLLAVLFMMAMHTDLPEPAGMESAIAESRHEEPPKEEIRAPQPPKQETSTAIATRDEIDEVLRSYSKTNPSPEVITPEKSEEKSKSQEVAAPRPKPEPKPAPSKESSADSKFVEVTVKRGDYLEKIARVNGTTVNAIMKANDLPNARIDIGQVLRIPLGKSNSSTAAKSDQKSRGREVASNEPEYYTIRSGDNPWKIAKQFHVRFDDLLKLNDLDEAKARSLKPGDVLRVK